MGIESMQVIAHRGANAYAPENTAAAFDAAVRLGADSMETDIRASKDGQLVLIHDSAVDRTSNGKGLVCELTFAELSRLDYGQWFDSKFRGENIMLLSNFLEKYGGRIHLTLEIKARETEEELARVIKSVPELDYGGYAVTSFDRGCVLRVMELLPGASTGLLTKHFTKGEVDFCLENNISQICPPAENLAPGAVEHAHSRGLAVRAWGVPDAKQMKRAADIGVDGMTVDFPDKLILYINSLNPASNKS